MSYATYSSPFSARYASEEMLALWSAQRRHSIWRRLWYELARIERELGVDIPEAALSEMSSHLENINFAAVADYEERTRHDVMAHIHAFGDVAPAARGFIHLGATSCFVTDNADLVLMREGLTILRARAFHVLRALRAFAEQWKTLPTLGYTHLQPAQLTTVGKRATLWMQDLVLDIAELDNRIGNLPFRGVKGTTGTQASFLSLFGGDHDRVRELDRRVAAAMGFASVIPVTGQTYSRKVDAQVLGAVAGLAASGAKFAGDIRMLQAFGEMAEPFGSGQVGSSAMAYIRIPMRSERINAIARFAGTLEANANLTHSVQYFERTLDDSANRRLVIPEAFLAVDSILLLQHGVVKGLEVHRGRIEARVRDELPFMATEELILRAVNGGMSRQDAHEAIRRHSLDAARHSSDTGEPNDLLQRLAKEPALSTAAGSLDAVLRPELFIGRAPQQVDDFLREVIDPLLERESMPDIRFGEVKV
ncbi:MAG: adenylosuccinate lyase [Gemmatimonadota bacterium]